MRKRLFKHSLAGSFWREKVKDRGVPALTCSSGGATPLGSVPWAGGGGQLGPIRADPLLPQPLDRASHGDEVVQQVSPTSYLSVWFHVTNDALEMAHGKSQWRQQTQPAPHTQASHLLTNTSWLEKLHLLRVNMLWVPFVNIWFLKCSVPRLRVGIRRGEMVV